VPSTLATRIRRLLAAASAGVFVLTGAAYGLYHEVTAGITTTDVIAGGGGGEQNILLVGIDSRTDATGDPLPPEVLRELHAGDEPGVLNTDAIMLLHIPENGGAGIAFSVPRDAYVAIPGHGPDKVNAAYPSAKAAAAQELVDSGEHDPAVVEAEAARRGRRALVQTVQDLTGLTVDHYAEVNLLGFYNLTKAIGGVEVCLNAAVDEPLSGAHLPAGRQTISGGDALAFVRQRHGLSQGDLSRVRRQQVFLAAVAHKILSSGTLRDRQTLGRLLDVAERSLVIDQDWDLLEFAQQAADIAAGNLEFATIPTKGSQTNDRGDVVVVDSFEVRRFVDRRVEELTAAAERAAAAPPSPAVDVRNASSVSGMAALVADRMVALGHPRGEVGNSRLSIRSVVRHPGSDDTAAVAVAGQLGELPVERDDSVAQGRVEVVLGSDFDRSVLAAPLPAARPQTRPADEVSGGDVPCVD